MVVIVFINKEREFLEADSIYLHYSKLTGELSEGVGGVNDFRMCVILV